MRKSILKGFVDAIYGTNSVRKKYTETHPGETVLASDASKGIITSDNTQIESGANWITSQRAVILLTNERIKCGKWEIPLETITESELVKIKSLFGGGQVLKIQTEDGKNYQFGMQLNPEWTNQTRLPLTLEKGKVKKSVFSLIARLILIGWIVYWIYTKFLAR